MKLYDFFNLVFSECGGFEKMSKYDRSKFHFMTNRAISVKFPKAANDLNGLKVNTEQTVSVWHDIFGKFNTIPSWVSKINRASKGTKQKTKYKMKFTPEDVLIKKYIEMNGISMKEYNRLLELYPQQLEMELKSIIKLVE